MERQHWSNLIQGDFYAQIHKLFCQECRVDLICTDIPYVISKTNNYQSMPDRKGRVGIDFGLWDKEFSIEKLSILPKILRCNGSIVLFHSFEQYSDVRKVMEDNGMVCKDKFIWQKTNPMPRNRDRRYISDCEMGSWYVKKGAKWTYNRQDDKYQSMVFRYPSESGGGQKRYHPTQKNLKQIKELIAIHSNEGDTVLDPFMGGGTTAIACMDLNRHFIGIELDENYFKVVQERVNKQKNILFPFLFA